MLRFSRPSVNKTRGSPQTYSKANTVLSIKRGQFGTRHFNSRNIDVEGWITGRFKPYDGSSEFLAGPTPRTSDLWNQCSELMKEERKHGVLDIDTVTPSGILSHAPGYIDKDKELIVGLQTDAPLKRAIKPFGGINMVRAACDSYGYQVDKGVEEIFTKYRKTHNQGVFDIYNKDMKTARSNGILTGLPDGYGRGRIIGDYRRVALYGLDKLIEAKRADREELGKRPMLEDNLRLTEEVTEQIRALKAMKELGKAHGYDLSRPAKSAKEAVQWLYFGYLAAIKEQDGAAMSLGRVDSFLDVYFEEDLKNGVITEQEAQEIIDDFVIKLRIARHLRTPEYNDLFAGDPTWVTAVLGGKFGGGHMVTKTSFRFLQTLHNLGPSPEPNLTVLWSSSLPENWKKFCTKTSIDTSSIQYENDDLMQPLFGSDYGIACCVSAMRIGKDMQFFGARCNLAKLLLYALNSGVDEVTGKQVGPATVQPVEDGVPLKYEDVLQRYDKYMDWLAELYVNTMNVIHYSHDKYSYEAAQMALHDTEIRRLMAFGVAGLSVTADSLSAIRYGKVTPIKDERGLVSHFKTEGTFPKYGNDDDKVDSIAKDILERFIHKLKQHGTYRNAEHTLSVLTITSNVVYGLKTGDTPDGRKKGEAFAPGANPMHGRDDSGALASLNSVAKMPYEACLDGISNTFSIVPSALGKGDDTQVSNLSALLDGYFEKGAHHLNVNALNRETLMHAMEHPEKYPNLTIRVSGYAVHFVRLTRAQQEEVIARTFHGMM